MMMRLPMSHLHPACCCRYVAPPSPACAPTWARSSACICSPATGGARTRRRAPRAPCLVALLSLQRCAAAARCLGVVVRTFLIWKNRQKKKKTKKTKKTQKKKKKKKKKEGNSVA